MQFVLRVWSTEARRGRLSWRPSERAEDSRLARKPVQSLRQTSWSQVYKSLLCKEWIKNTGSR